MKHYMLTSPAFIGGTLLAEGSRINDADLGKAKDKNGKLVQVRPPSDAIEVDVNGQPVNDEAAQQMAALAGDLHEDEIAPVAPFAPFPTQPQGAPPQAPGGVQVVASQQRTKPARGVSPPPTKEEKENAENADDGSAAKAKSEEPQRRS